MTTNDISHKLSTNINLTFQDINLHHFSLNIPKQQIRQQLSCIRFVFIGGCPQRAHKFGLYLQDNLFDGNSKAKLNLNKLSVDSSRFDLYQIGPVLVADHGMGSASMSIAVHELILMCHIANVVDKITLIRFGTCGGIGVTPGSVCITTKAIDPLYRDYIEIPICGNLVKRPCNVDQETASLLIDTAKREEERLKNSKPLGNGDEFVETKQGFTISTNDFYEEQGRTNGAICEHTEEDKLNYLFEAHRRGVINFEMEAHHLVGMCTKLNIKHGILCVALNDRLISDRILLNRSQIDGFERKLFRINSLLVEHQLDSTQTYAP